MLTHPLPPVQQFKQGYLTFREKASIEHLRELPIQELFANQPKFVKWTHKAHVFLRRFRGGWKCIAIIPKSSYSEFINLARSVGFSTNPLDGDGEKSPIFYSQRFVCSQKISKNRTRHVSGFYDGSFEYVLNDNLSVVEPEIDSILEFNHLKIINDNSKLFVKFSYDRPFRRLGKQILVLSDSLRLIMEEMDSKAYICYLESSLLFSTINKTTINISSAIRTLNDCFEFFRGVSLTLLEYQIGNGQNDPSVVLRDLDVDQSKAPKVFRIFDEKSFNISLSNGDFLRYHKLTIENEGFQNSLLLFKLAIQQEYLTLNTLLPIAVITLEALLGALSTYPIRARVNLSEKVKEYGRIVPNTEINLHVLEDILCGKQKNTGIRNPAVHRLVYSRSELTDDIYWYFIDTISMILKEVCFHSAIVKHRLKISHLELQTEINCLRRTGKWI